MSFNLIFISSKECTEEVDILTGKTVETSRSKYIGLEREERITGMTLFSVSFHCSSCD